MNSVMTLVNFVIANFQPILTATIGALTGIIGISLLIPGDQPEKALQSIVDFISKFSKK